jgi:hypothetical protein
VYSTKQSDDPAERACRSEGILGLECHYLEQSHLSCRGKQHEKCVAFLSVWISTMINPFVGYHRRSPSSVSFRSLPIHALGDGVLDFDPA